jgi:hypothetical protein
MTQDSTNNLRSGLDRMREVLHQKELTARKQRNQNLADIVKSAAGKIHQIMQHPDFDAVQDLHTGSARPAYLKDFRAELDALEKSGNGETDRAKELRAQIKVAEDAKPPESPPSTPFPGTADYDA